MPNHGYCKNCWWWKLLPTIMPYDVEDVGKCYMHSTDGAPYYTPPTSYCPDYVNRKKEDKNGTLDELLSKLNWV